MKTKLFIIFMILCGVVNAQYTKLLEFNGTNGFQPLGSVILSSNDSVLYGMTSGWYLSDSGNIYSINTDGTGYSEIYDFSTDTASGVNPFGSLIRSGNMLYGMTSGGGGVYGGGTIFSVQTNGSNYTVLHKFPTNGGNPWGTLTISGTTLYGMSYYGGTSNYGTVFSINTNGTGFTTLLNFNGPNGKQPGYGALTLSGNTLYGTTMYGGVNIQGNIFSIQTNGSGYIDMFDFNTANGSTPLGSLTLIGNVLYGTCDNGGVYNKGIIFSIHTDGTGYRDLFDFNGLNGEGPSCTLTLSGNILYGSTEGGGTNDNGTIFSIDTDGTGFQSIYSFYSPNGTGPNAQLSMVGNMLYGTGIRGGLFDDGVVFSFKTHPAPLPICMVTVDDSSKYNQIIWDKPLVTYIDSFIVYREITSNNYRQIGAVPYSALSEFTDTVRAKYFPFTGNPNAGTFRYKLQFRDTSGYYSQFSPYHNTLYVTQSSGTFNWNQYSIEGDTVPIPLLTAYVLYRDDNNTGNWHAVQGVSSTQTTVTDPDFALYPNGKWRVETTWGISCNPSKTYSTSKSNVKSSGPNGIETIFSTESVNIYPSPVSDNLTIEVTLPSTIEISNIQGQLIKTLTSSGTKTNVDVSEFSNGVYVVEVRTEKGVAVKKFVKE